MKQARKRTLNPSDGYVYHKILSTFLYVWKLLTAKYWGKRTFKEQTEALGIKNVIAEMKYSIE